MLHIPLLRRGRPYRSLDVTRVPHHATRQPFVEISQANAGLIRRDLTDQDSARAALAAVPVARLFESCQKAADLFLEGTLPIGDESQAPEDYVRQLSATTGMPHVMVRRNMQRVASVLRNLPDILRGLTRGLDPAVLDRGFGELNGQAVSFAPRAHALGVVLPSNSPGVHGLWLPAIPLKMPLVLRPGSSEPWTPFRLLQALMACGVPPEACSYYPSDHAGAGEIVRRCGRSMFFGDLGAIGTVAGDPRVELHGPGYSKVLIGPDMASRTDPVLDAIVTSVAANGGRSCVNASGIWLPADSAAALSEALAKRLAVIQPRAADDPEAAIAPFVDPAVARRISQQIDAGLDEPGAEEVTARFRTGPRLVEMGGCTYLLPTVIHCHSSSHSLANREFLFPFVSVVDVSPDEMAAMPAPMGPTLACMVLTEDRALIDRVLRSDSISRLNLGPIPTNEIRWDQPHEGNLFEHLYVRRSFQRAG
jgi:acyl-CoA reductase-like NAD-dependent aldehyde dehydrogenase